MVSKGGKTDLLNETERTIILWDASATFLTTATSGSLSLFSLSSIGTATAVTTAAADVTETYDAERFALGGFFCSVDNVRRL